ncbi:MAG: ABC transporter ATP-binding protein [Dehalococcoidales bacterium]|jgi:molybdate transport system ATP-binding protein|nr:ABC transporter ATP-binding protein [Dehalococcoidales bacterium]MDD3264983.1 ABC transporter ATP-binding protein [Dehalococcoidales bacterium]MDD4322636.1 ABC transporter ATP-binding protein [Dehalococcoidales bacterium]MDD4793794.1 ABC transporter ATP-binding protein [Dehalococcoidales bacterium]MDD5498603.1 ABC transporter ATP-binding protein [Dehalococcoidales bacterium]
MLEVEIKKAVGNFYLDLKLSVNREILSILGPSGSGKTMTLLCIAGLMRPDTGYIKLNGKVLYDSKEKIFLSARQRNIGFVFQNFALFPHLTVNENIAYGIKDQPKDIVTSKVQELLKLMHIPSLGSRYPREISSGQQQRVALARAIAPSPDALLLDEPFSALDTPQRERLEYELVGIQELYNKDFLFVTHDLTQGYKLSTRLAVFDAGRIAQCDYKKNVVNRPLSQAVAKLTGIKNLMEGYITNIEGNNIHVLVPELDKPLHIFSANSGHFTVSDQVTIGIRPEYVQIAENEGENTICCDARQLIDGVSCVRGRFNAASDTERKYNFEVDLQGQVKNQPAEGCMCMLYFPPEKLVVFNR